MSLSGGLECMLAAGRYGRYWEENKEEIIAALYAHTKLRFKQRKITVHVISGSTSRAGNSVRPMELSIENVTQDEIAYTLVHELSHRLVIGNGIQPSAKNDHARSRASYNMHRHIFLFLYDVMVDLIGADRASRCVANERALHVALYDKAWSWALDMTYDERQAAFSRLKKSYKTGVH